LALFSLIFLQREHAYSNLEKLIGAIKLCEEQTILERIESDVRIKVIFDLKFSFSNNIPLGRKKSIIITSS